MAPVVRIIDAGLGEQAPVRLVVAGLEDPDAFRGAWAPSGASIERVGDRLHAISTVRALTRAAGRGLPRPQADQLVVEVQSALTAWQRPTPDWKTASVTIGFADDPVVMGIVNVTPDSFSDGGRWYPDGHPDAAVRAGRGIAADGAAIIDVGGESTRPGSEPVPLDEELRRVVPVIERLAAEGHVVSVDTRKPDVARRAVEAGAAIVNDVSGGTDPALLEAVADTGAGYVLMHTRGTPDRMQELTGYDDVVAEVYEYLRHGIDRCVGAGIDVSRIAVDPGIGFAKTATQNLVLMGSLRQFRGLDRPLLLGVSRKSFLGAVTGREDPAERWEAGLACAAVATQAGVGIMRVHDVASTVQVLRTTAAVAAAGRWVPPVGSAWARERIRAGDADVSAVVSPPTIG